MKPPVTSSALAFIKRVEILKQGASPPDSTWYGYDIMGNVWHLENLLDGKLGDVLENAHGPIADIGCADGDLGFFLESEGREVDLVDWPATNWNGMRGVRTLHGLLDSAASIAETDLDAYFELPRERYGLAFMLGILYHLKNPYFVLEKLASRCERIVISTRVASQTAQGVKLDGEPVAYLVDPAECNNDSTNYWIFSQPGLKRLVTRCGWEIEAWKTVGCTTGSEPAHPDRDERAFALLRSTRIGPAE